MAPGAPSQQFVTQAELIGLEPGLTPAELPKAGWLPVSLPSDVYRVLVAAGRLAEPDAAADESDWSWVSEQEWWYRLNLPRLEIGPGERTMLTFEGLDTYADIWVDGDHAATTASMFVPLSLDVTGAAGEVLVRFRRPLDVVGPVEPVLGVGLLEGPRTRMRKAQFGYGWDFVPNRPSVGIWRPVWLRRERKAAITGLHAATVDLAPDHSSAVLRVSAEIDAFVASEGLDIRVNLLNPSGQELATATAAVREGRASAALALTQPQLWWPNGSGEPVLHHARIELLADGELLDSRELEIGIHTIRLDESHDPGDPGSRYFRFVVNGRPIFATGANWIPCSTAVAAVPPERYADLLGLAHDAHVNMLRVWGGGVYEDDEFYSACDRLGILIWQEFGFACATYPTDAKFLTLVDAEARAQVRRIRSHPCLALWCGNNEVEMISGLLLGGFGRADALFYETLPNAVADLDGITDYLPSSPSFPEDQRQGDRHVWEVWHGFGGAHAGSALVSGEALSPDSTEAAAYLQRISPNRYLADVSRFVSEFGLLSGPTRETYERWIGSPDAPVDLELLAHRVRDRVGPANKLQLVARAALGRQEMMGDVLDGSHIAQAEGLILGIGHYRRLAPHCSGTLIWQLDDCWPGFSWSLLDFDGRPKPAYYAVRRAFAPVGLVLEPQPDGGLALWGINSTLATHQETLDVRLRTYAGDLLFARELPVSVPPGSTQLATFTTDELRPADNRYLRVTSRGGSLHPVRHLFDQLSAIDTSPDIGWSRVGSTLSMSSERYVFAVNLSHPDSRVRFSDSYVDVEPGEPRQVHIEGPAGVDLGRLQLVTW